MTIARREIRRASPGVSAGSLWRTPTGDDRPDAHRAGLPVQPDRARRRAGPGARPGPRAAARWARGPGARPVRRAAAATFVTPLGNSLPTAANGSMAPLAPDPSAALRTIRALGDERFDVAPPARAAGARADDDGAAVTPAPIVGTFHAAGDCASYRYLRPVAAAGRRRIDHAVAVSKDALELVAVAPRRRLRLLFNGVELDADRSTPADADDRTRRSSSAAATRSARASPCCSRRSASSAADVRLWVAGDGPDTAALRARHARRRADRVARPDDRRREVRPAARRRRVLRAVAARRVVRRRADRGDGRRHRRRGQRPRRLPQRRHRRRRRAARRAGRRRRARRALRGARTIRRSPARSAPPARTRAQQILDVAAGRSTTSRSTRARRSGVRSRRDRRARRTPARTLERMWILLIVIAIIVVLVIVADRRRTTA